MPAAAPSFELFISHVSREKVFAHEMADCFESYGIKTFVAHDDINPGRHWVDQIAEALNRCDAVLSLHHAGFMGSQWCEQEVGWALGRLVPVVPIRFEEDPRGFAGQVQAIQSVDKRRNAKNATVLSREALSVLLADARVGENVMALMSYRLATSWSWSMSNSIIRVWNDLDVLPTQAQYHDLVAAELSNVDVKQANAWPGLKQKLIREYGEYASPFGFEPFED